MIARQAASALNEFNFSFGSQTPVWESPLETPFRRAGRDFTSSRGMQLAKRSFAAVRSQTGVWERGFVSADERWLRHRVLPFLEPAGYPFLDSAFD